MVWFYLLALSYCFGTEVSMNNQIKYHLPPHLFTTSIWLAPLQQNRRIWVMLPPSYFTSKEKKYPVLYLQDGQNLFLAEASFSGEWGVDEAVSDLYQQQRMPEIIVVGIDNGGVNRFNEYSPWINNSEEFTRGQGQGGNGDKYLQALTENVLPWVETNYRVDHSQFPRCIGGSSMGGLISLYAQLSYPEVFPCSLVISPAFWFAFDQIKAFTTQRLPLISTPLKIYMDVGTNEAPYQTAYLEYAQRISQLLSAPSVHHQLFIDPGGIHQESAWRRRLPQMLQWIYQQ